MAERGEIVQKEYFPLHCKNTARLNHGSFGSAPKPVWEAKIHYQEQWLLQPDEFYYFKLHDLQAKSRQQIASLVNCKPETISLVNNATTAAALVAQKVMWDLLLSPSKEKSYVLQFDICYGAVRKSVEALLLRAGAELLEVTIPFPSAGDEEILTLIEQKLQSVPKGSVKIALIDHISSCPAILFPVKRIVQLCRDYQVGDIFVDGAHTIGQIPLDLEDLGADYYTSNLHKWLFAPVGAAFLYTAPNKDQPGSNSTIHHVVPSFYYDTGLPNETKWAGTDDYSSRLAIPEAIRFYSAIGFALAENDLSLLELPYASLVARYNLQGDELHFNYGIADSNRKQALEMSRMLAEAWGTRVITPEEAVTSLVMLETPNKPPYSNTRNYPDAEVLRHRIRKQYQVEAILYANSTGCYLRLSSQIYNTRKDYLRLRDAILALIEE